MNGKEKCETQAQLLESPLKSQLYKGFDAFMSFSFCFSSIAVITSLSLVINYGLETGGPVVMTWGWLIACMFTLCVGSQIAEICSVYPVAGSVYYWSGVLSSEKWAPFNSYMCGWLYLIGNIACDSSFAYGFSQMFAALLQALNDGDEIVSEISKVSIAVVINLEIVFQNSNLEILNLLLGWAVKNALRLDKQGSFNNFSALYQFISTIIVIAILIFASVPDKLSSNKFVWTNFNNSTGFDDMKTQNLVFIYFHKIDNHYRMIKIR